MIEKKGHSVQFSPSLAYHDAAASDGSFTRCEGGQHRIFRPDLVKFYNPDRQDTGSAAGTEGSAKMGSPAVLEAQIRELQVFIPTYCHAIIKNMYYENENSSAHTIEWQDCDDKYQHQHIFNNSSYACCYFLLKHKHPTLSSA
jgi:hypothetical protein